MFAPDLPFPTSVFATHTLALKQKSGDRPKKEAGVETEQGAPTLQREGSSLLTVTIAAIAVMSPLVLLCNLSMCLVDMRHYFYSLPLWQSRFFLVNNFVVWTVNLGKSQTCFRRTLAYLAISMVPWSMCGCVRECVCVCSGSNFCGVLNTWLSNARAS